MLGLHNSIQLQKVASGPFPNLLISVLEYTHSAPFIKLLKTLLSLRTYKLVRSFPRPFHPFFLTGHLIFTQLSTYNPAYSCFPSWVAYVWNCFFWAASTFVSSAAWIPEYQLQLMHHLFSNLITILLILHRFTQFSKSVVIHESRTPPCQDHLRWEFGALLHPTPVTKQDSP